MDKCDVQQEAPAATTFANSNKWRTTSIVAICVGLLLLCAGLFSWFEDESLNDALVQAGASQAVHACVLEEPSSASYALCAAEVIEKAVEARTTSPEALATLLGDAADGFVTPGVKHLLVVIINQVNAAHKVSSSEDIYLNRLLFLAKGIREGVCAS